MAALDLSLWLGTSEAAARLLHLNQSTVSRQRRLAMQGLDLQLLRQGSERMLLGDRELLAAERLVHQLARLKGKAPLRVDGTYASGPWFLADPVAGWIRGNFDLPGREVPLRLLRKRVIDAWVASYQPDLPDADDPDWWVLDLTRQPVRLLAAPDHPLAREHNPSHCDLTFPQPGPARRMVPANRNHPAAPGALAGRGGNGPLRPHGLGGPLRRWGHPHLRHQPE